MMKLKKVYGSVDVQLISPKDITDLRKMKTLVIEKKNDYLLQHKFALNLFLE